MSLDADTIVDRRRMRRKLTVWRGLAVLLAIGAVIAIGAAVASPNMGLAERSGAQIARIQIRGLIRNDQERVAALETLGKARRARAVIVHVDSPGGTTAGAEQLHDALLRLAAQ